MNTRTRQREETRQKILEAARNCFDCGDFARVSTREVARQAGVAEGTVFNHFPTKEDLVMSCICSQMAEAIEMGLYTMDPEWCFVDKLMHVASYRFAQIGLHPGLWRVIMQQIVFTPRKGVVNEAGELNPDLSPEMIRKSLMALFIFTIHEHLSTQNYDSEDMCATLRELVMVQTVGLWAAKPELAA